MNKFFTFSFWFDTRPLPFNSTMLWAILIVFGLGLVLGIIGLLLEKKLKANKIGQEIWSRLIRWGFSFGIVGLLLVFLKHQRAPYLGMRIWLSLWLLICLIWMIFILRYVFVEVPKLKKLKEQESDFKKYLPK